MLTRLAACFDPALAAAAAPSFATTSSPPGSTTLSRDFSSTPGVALSDSTTSGTSTSRSRPPPTSTSPTDPARSSDEGTPLGVMIGAIAGAVGAVVLIAMLIMFLILRRRRRRAEQERILHEKAAGQGNGKHISRHFDPNYHSSKDWKHKHRSFLNILTPTSKGEGSFPSNEAGGKGGTKPISELFANPKSFFSPRTAPLPAGVGVQRAGNDSVETLRYTTTSERLKGRDRLDSFSSGSESSFGIGPPKVTAYVKAKHNAHSPIPPTAPVTASNATESMMSTTTTQYGVPAGQSDLLRAVNDMRTEQEVANGGTDRDDPLETPPVKDFDKHSSYPFPRVADPVIPITAATDSTMPITAPASPAPDTGKALPKPPGTIKTRISTNIPDPRFSSSAITIPRPPITPAHDFTLPPDEYRRKQSRRYSGPKTMYEEDDKSVVLPSLYEPSSGAARYSVSQRTDKRKSMAPSAATRSSGIWTVPNTPTKRTSASGFSEGDSVRYSATPSNDSRYPSFLPDAQTVARVKAAFGGATPPLRFPLPPSRSGSKDPEHEWERAKSKEKLSHEVKKIGRKSPVQERGNENGTRRAAA